MKGACGIPGVPWIQTGIPANVWRIMRCVPVSLSIQEPIDGRVTDHRVSVDGYRKNSNTSCPRVILDGTRAHADEVPHHLCRRKDDMKTLRQAHQPFVQGPELHVRRDQGGGQQGHIHQAAALNIYAP